MISPPVTMVIGRQDFKQNSILGAVVCGSDEGEVLGPVETAVVVEGTLSELLASGVSPGVVDRVGCNGVDKVSPSVTFHPPAVEVIF